MGNLPKAKSDRGFSMLEMLMVVSIVMILGGFAIGNFSTAQRNSRIAGSNRDLSALVSEAKLSGAAAFTHAPECTLNLSAKSTITWRSGTRTVTAARAAGKPPGTSSTPARRQAVRCRLFLRA